MNRYTTSEYREASQRLALGVEVVDRVREMGLMHPVRIDIEREVPHTMKSAGTDYHLHQPPGRPPDALSRHFSGRYALLYHSVTGAHVILRIYDHQRYYIPRRLQVPLLTEEQIEAAATRDVGLRIRRPVLFPGAAYDLSRTATGLRGSVVRDGAPLRWAVIDATMPDSGELVGRARSDDRGEFLLLLTPGAAPDSDLPRTIDVRVSVAGPATAPVPASAGVPDQDEFWDLPLEVLPTPGDTDDVSAGDAFPADYATALSATRTVSFEIGKLLTGADEAPFEFSLP